MSLFIKEISGSQVEIWSSIVHAPSSFVALSHLGCRVAAPGTDIDFSADILQILPGSLSSYSWMDNVLGGRLALPFSQHPNRIKGILAVVFFAGLIGRTIDQPRISLSSLMWMIQLKSNGTIWSRKCLRGKWSQRAGIRKLKEGNGHCMRTEGGERWREESLNPRHAMLTNSQGERALLFPTSEEILFRFFKKVCGAKSHHFYMTQKCFDKWLRICVWVILSLRKVNHQVPFIIMHAGCTAECELSYPDASSASHSGCSRVHGLNAELSHQTLHSIFADYANLQTYGDLHAVCND